MTLVWIPVLYVDCFSNKKKWQYLASQWLAGEENSADAALCSLHFLGVFFYVLSDSVERYLVLPSAFQDTFLYNSVAPRLCCLVIQKYYVNLQLSRLVTEIRKPSGQKYPSSTHQLLEHNPECPNFLDKSDNREYHKLQIGR